MGPTMPQRLLGILSGFDNECSAWTLSALARRLNMPLSTAHRLVHEFLAWGALQRDESGLLYVGSWLLCPCDFWAEDFLGVAA
ncbi:helix-turn-helix domain-containing protein [Mycobacteroides abscessus]|uniref:helix-turn-helix domain-containing protein n=2 Tax=Mycobacteroides abscessus TaxID=36809 RepID=UPI000C2573EC